MKNLPKLFTLKICLPFIHSFIRSTNTYWKNIILDIILIYHKKGGDGRKERGGSIQMYDPVIYTLSDVTELGWGCTPTGIPEIGRNGGWPQIAKEPSAAHDFHDAVCHHQNPKARVIQGTVRCSCSCTINTSLQPGSWAWKAIRIPAALPTRTPCRRPGSFLASPRRLQV